MKYKFSFELTEDIEGQIASYETESEPFRLGDLVYLGEVISDPRLDDYFKVVNIWRMVTSPSREEILFTLERYKT